MAAVSFRLRDRGRSRDKADLRQSPVYFGLYDSATGRDWAILGAKTKTFLIRDRAVSHDTAVLTARVGFTLRDHGQSRDRAFLTERPTVAAFFAFRDSAIGRDTANLNAITVFTLRDSARSRDVARFFAEVPRVEFPSTGQFWGTVNLVENPSLEYDGVDLTGWSAEEITLTRTSAAVAMGGEFTCRAVLDAAADSPEVVIRSVLGLAETGFGRRWVGSAYLRGDSQPLAVVLRLVYRDGSQVESVPTVIDETNERPLNDTWWQYASEPMSSDGAKEIEHLELVIQGASNPGSPITVRIDAVQIEEALAGHATAYVDGDQGEGCTWLGQPGASMSMRVTA